MFKKSDNNPRIDIFSPLTEYFQEAKKKKYMQNDFWHNLLRKLTVMHVDKTILSVPYADVAYLSVENQVYCQSNRHNTDLALITMQGVTPRSDIRLDKHDVNDLSITNNKTGEVIQAHPIETLNNNEKKSKIKTENGKWKHVDFNSIMATILKQKTERHPDKGANTSTDFETTISRLEYHYPNNKSHHRQLAREKLWTYPRLLGVNFVGIVNYFSLSHTNRAKIAVPFHIE